MGDAEQAPARQAHVRSYAAALARAGAVLAALVYGTGFVILAGYDAHYGIFEFEPVRARVFLVGFAFVALSALPAAAKHYGLAYFGPLEPVVRNTDSALRVQKEVVLAAGFVYTAVLIAGQFSFYLFSAAEGKPGRGWSTLVPATVAWLVVLMAYRWVGRTFVEHPTRAAVVAVSSSAALLGLLYFSWPRPSANMTLWFSLVALAVMDVELARDRLRHALDFRTWFFALGLLVFYVTALFGAIQPRFGGGAPQPAVLYLSRPVAWLKAGTLDGSLVDETDQGFYVLLGPRDKALFLPRDSVAAVYFGPKADLPSQPK